MNKLILSLGLVAALSGSAFAQSAYDNAAAGDYDRGAMQSDSMQPAPVTDRTDKSIDTTTTGSISSTNSQDPTTQVRRGDQGNVFGANGN